MEPPQRLVQRVHHVDGRRVVVRPLRPARPRVPVAGHERDVQEPRLHGRLALGDVREGSVRERDRREPGRGGEALLRPAVDGVEPPVVHADGDAAQARHGVRDHEAPVVAGDGRQRLGVRERAGRGLGVDKRDDLGLGVAPERVFERLGWDGPPPLGVYDDGHPARALDHLAEAVAEHAVPAHDGCRSRPDEVDHARLHAGRARPRDRHRQPVLGEERVLQEPLRLVHEVHERRVEVAQRRPGERGEHVGVDRRRAGTHQRADGRGEGGHGRGGCWGLGDRDWGVDGDVLSVAGAPVELGAGRDQTGHPAPTKRGRGGGDDGEGQSGRGGVPNP